MYIIGISAFYHDSSISIIKDGEILFAAQEERYTRIKNDSSFPELALQAGLGYLKILPHQVDAIVFYEKPFLKFERILETYLNYAPRGFLSFLKSMPPWIKEKLFQKKIIAKKLIQMKFSKDIINRIYFSDHHLSHAASAFYPSPFQKALVLTMDGVGEWPTTTVYTGVDSELKKIKEIHFPHSLGLLYSAFTYYCGFKVNSGEYKLMGLAPFGQPKYSDLIKKELIDIKSDGSFHLNMKYFDYCTGLKMTNKQFDNLFGKSFRRPTEPILQIHMDIAASIQLVLEEIIIKICKSLKSDYPEYTALVLAGGVALNCVVNGKIEQEKIFEHLWIQPASGDAGGSLGAALAFYYNELKNNRVANSDDQMNGSYLGNDYSNLEIKNFLTEIGASFHFFPNEKSAELLNLVCHELCDEKAVGWFQGRMEFGPRALGNRSILASPVPRDMQKKLNIKIKFRESFRPFAPAILEEEAWHWYNIKTTSSYMLKTATINKNYQNHVPAVTHVDQTARLQTVNKKTNLIFHRLISEFYKKSQIPMLVNTSFNIRGEPIVESPQDAFRCFMGTHLDVLVMNSFLLYKDEQPSHLKSDYRESIED
ncbi:MAG: hypothetical protein A2622_05900 [Bdellovibrionales bacterium RIFCSPHIGHO2_01_FULL_40_29]|nr:MAG: hypothetical protein A2622_05900 [Bdellovibrionales bacterium RIFCSPHIGHO2_01_FULL_40_29]OFZ34986.1 MAG: hypothetical protein A3D17_06250 [Bdellovibrionales bacterium RIFCSPHIGHO2_02_FULL_40_15]